MDKLLIPRIQPSRILEASRVIKPIFLNSPQIYLEKLSKKLGVNILLKIETLNPIRSFKGRGADFFLSTLPKEIKELVCASAGNFGQGLGYAARNQGRNLTVFSSLNANPLKIDSMRAFNAKVIQEGDDFDKAKAAAISYAQKHKAFFVEDGRDVAISEGAGTIAAEIHANGRIDFMVVSVGNGALINGIGAYSKYFFPSTKIIGVVASGAPSMLLSWQQNKPIATDSISTIADGIAVRVPVPEALLDMQPLIDGMTMVSEQNILEAMKVIVFDLGLMVEPAGAVGLAAILSDPSKYQGKTVATILTGANLTQNQMKSLLF